MSDSTQEPERPTCPDGGACHHGCRLDCFRVHGCGPLSGVFPDDKWPAHVLSNPAPVFRGPHPTTDLDRAKALWMLLDHIDTLGDIVKGDDAGFRREIQKFLKQRFQILDSDGYELFLPGTREPDNKQPSTPQTSVKED